MPHAITIRPDSGSADRVRALWQQLEQAGIPLGFDPGLIEPHLTLAVVESESEPDGSILPALQAWCRRFAARMPALPVRISHLGLFPATEEAGATLFLGIAAGGPVRDAFLGFREGLPDGCRIADPVYDPARWIPHISLAIGLDHRSATRAAGFMLNSFLPWTADAADLELYEYFPVRRVLRMPLGPCDCGMDRMQCSSCQRVRWAARDLD